MKRSLSVALFLLTLVILAAGTTIVFIRQTDDGGPTSSAASPTTARPSATTAPAAPTTATPATTSPAAPTSTGPYGPGAPVTTGGPTTTAKPFTTTTTPATAANPTTTAAPRHHGQAGYDIASRHEWRRSGAERPLGDPHHPHDPPSSQHADHRWRVEARARHRLRPVGTRPLDDHRSLPGEAPPALTGTSRRSRVSPPAAPGTEPTWQPTGRATGPDPRCRRPRLRPTRTAWCGAGSAGELFFGGLALFLLLGLLNVYGVRTREKTVTGSGYELTLTYTSVTRPGLATPWSVEVRHPGGFDSGLVTVAATSSYFDAFDENGLDPDPARSTSDGERTIWQFEPPTGDTLTVSFDARIEPGVQLTRSRARWRCWDRPATTSCPPTSARS